jgi:hypothetical protein
MSSRTVAKAGAQASMRALILSVPPAVFSSAQLVPWGWGRTLTHLSASPKRSLSLPPMVTLTMSVSGVSASYWGAVPGCWAVRRSSTVAPEQLTSVSVASRPAAATRG